MKRDNKMKGEKRKKNIKENKETTKKVYSVYIRALFQLANEIEKNTEKEIIKEGVEKEKNERYGRIGQRDYWIVCC